MGNRSTYALVAAAVAIGLGIAGNSLLRGTVWGLNLPLWILLVGACGYGLLRKSDVTLSRAAKWLLLPIAVFSLCFCWRDSDALKVVNGFALVVAIGVLAQRAQKGKPAAATALEYTGNLALCWITFTTDFAELVTKDIDWSRSSVSARRIKGVLGGLLLAAPLVLVFGGLFMSADAAFEKAVEDFFSYDPNDLSLSFWVVLALAVLVGGLFRRLFWPNKPPALKPMPAEGSKRTLGQTEMVVALGAVDILFLTFVAFQFRFLFAGAGHIAKVANLTFAEYARGGFFELTAVTLLTVPILIGAQSLFPAGSVAFKRWLYALGSVLSGCLFVVIASALFRMNLYVQAYGLTELRLFTTLVVGWLGVTLAWLCVSFVLKQKSFAFGALVAGYAFVLVANFLNPDALIARTNLEAARTPDLGYMSQLSLDALPVISKDLGRVPAGDQEKFMANLDQNWNKELADADWRSLNYTRLTTRVPRQQFSPGHGK